MFSQPGVPVDTSSTSMLEVYRLCIVCAVVSTYYTAYYPISLTFYPINICCDPLLGIDHSLTHLP